jgi:phage gpG-like protein
MTELQEVAAELVGPYRVWLKDEREELSYLSARNFLSGQMDDTDAVMDGVADLLVELVRRDVCP